MGKLIGNNNRIRHRTLMEFLPKILHEECESILGPITRMFRRCIATGYMSEIWKKTRISFKPNPRENDYSMVKSFKPISLTSFMLKTMQSLMDLFIRQKILIYRPVYRRNRRKSTQTALYSVGSYLLRAKYTVCNRRSQISSCVS